MKKLIELKPKGKVVFVGDTHADTEASQAVFDEYLRPNTKIVFLGDYVDRGEQSRENADLVLGYHQKHPRKVFPLQGNHEGFYHVPYSPANFWMNLSPEDRALYHQKFSELPLAVSVGNVMAIHAALPNLESLADFNKIENGDTSWRDLVWGDYKEEMNQHRHNGTRRQFTKQDFLSAMNRYEKKLLIRGHDENGYLDMYDGRCLTILTSKNCPSKKRVVAIADFDKNPNIESIDDLDLKVL